MPNDANPPKARGQGALLVVAWAIVGIPLAYALVQTVHNVIPLFTG